MAAPLSPKLDWALANPLWSQTLNPIVNNPIVQGKQISNVVLVANTPLQVTHGLNRMMQGWFPVDNIANCNVWRTQNLNTKTLTIESSANTTLSLWVF